jgi:hypothetical protein
VADDELLLLRSSIAEHFSTTPYPGDKNIVSEESYHLEKRQVAEFFRGRDWCDIDLQTLRREYRGDESACLIFMTPEAFRYYLPSYLMICIDSYELADITYDTTIRRLTRPTRTDDVEWFAERFVPLAPEQAVDIARFLNLMHRLHEPPEGTDRLGQDAKLALDRYWGRFL